MKTNTLSVKTAIAVVLATGFAVFGMFSCQSGKKAEKNFLSEESVIAVHIPIHEIIKIGALYKVQDFCILQDVQLNARFHFYVYSYPDFQFLYAFCPKGNGAGEYLMPSIIRNTGGNVFAFRDHGTDTYVTYQLNDSCAVRVDEFRQSPVDDRFFWEINYIAGGEYVLKNSNSKQSSRDLWNIRENMRLDTLPASFQLALEMKQHYYTEFDDVWIRACGRKVAFSYFFIDRIEFGSVEGKRLRLTHHVGAVSPPDFHLFAEAASGKYPYSVENNPVYYEDLAVSERGVYGLYAGIPWGELDKWHSSFVEIYDWEGNALKRLKLDKSLASIVVDEAKGAIYGINPDTDEESILMFNYHL